MTDALDRMDALRDGLFVRDNGSLDVDIQENARFIMSACNNNATLVKIARIAATVEHDQSTTVTNVQNDDIASWDFKTECVKNCRRCQIDKLMEELK